MHYAETISEMLEIEELDRDLFRAINTVDAPQRRALYGGQVAAQALKAACLTVPDDRHPHSLHGYFLRPGKVDRPVILRVDRDRDGGAFSARHVVAVQDGEVIFSMIASFHVEVESATYEPTPRVVPPPEELEDGPWDHLLMSMREVARSHAGEGGRLHVTDCVWLRVKGSVPADRLTWACVMTYLSDMGHGFGQHDVPDLPNSGPSIDHAMWFHQPTAADDWVLVDLAPWKAVGRRGLYSGVLRDRHGTLAATLTQESLLRPPPPEAFVQRGMRT